MDMIDTKAIRKTWANKPDSVLKRANLKLCDDYEAAKNALLVMQIEGEEYLSKQTIAASETVKGA